MTSISSYFANAYAPVMRPAVQAATAASPATITNNSTTSAADAPASAATKPFSQVAFDARAALDAGYAKLGKVADDFTTGKEWRNTVGLDDLDRRTLYAIASNQGGMFSDTEMRSAQSTMTKQQGDAMMAADPTGKDIAALLRAGIDFLDGVSDEEKHSLRWTQGRAAAQTGYEWRMRDEGRVAENVDSGNLIVQLFVNAYNELAATNGSSQDVRNMPSWVRALDIWHLQNETSPGLSWTI